MTILTIDTKANAYEIPSDAMNNLQQNVANSASLDQGVFEISISSGSYCYASDNSQGEPFVLLWIYGVDGSTFVNQDTGYETGATWTTLNGYDNRISLKVNRKVVICALFFDFNKNDNQGEISLSISDINNPSKSKSLTVDSKRNCYLLNAQEVSKLQVKGQNLVELSQGSYKVKIREGNATYWSDNKKFNLEPWALLWVQGGKIISNLTKIEVAETWCSLNGLQDEIILEVKSKTNISGFFFDTYKADNEGQIILEIIPISESELTKKYQEKEQKIVGRKTINENSVTVVGSGQSSTTETEFSMGVSSDFNFSFDQEQMETMWRDMAAKIETSVTVTDEKDEKKEAAYWDNLEKWLLKGYQSQAKKLAMQVAKLEFMMKTMTQQMEVNFTQNFQAWSKHFNKNLNEIFVTRIPRIVQEQVNLQITDKTQEIKNLVIQQIQAELNERVESIVNLKITNQTQEVKNLVVQQVQADFEQRIDNVVNLKVANQATEINTQVVNQISNDIDQRIDNAVSIKIANQTKEITNQVIQQIQQDLDQRVNNVVSIKISDQTQNVKNLVIQQMQTYIDQRIDNVVNLKVANQAQEINTQVISQIQSDIDQRINAVVNLKVNDQVPNIKNLVVQQIEADFENRIKSLVNQSTNNNVQLVVNNVMGDIDNRIDVNLENKIINFRNDVATLVKNEINQNFTESLKSTILSDIKKQQFYMDMQSIKAEVENFYARLGQFETQLYLRVEQGDTQLYNWTLEQLVALQGCLTDRQALVEMFEVFANRMKDELDNAECVQPHRFTPWVRREMQASLESQDFEKLPQG